MKLKALRTIWLLNTNRSKAKYSRTCLVHTQSSLDTVTNNKLVSGTGEMVRVPIHGTSPVASEKQSSELASNIEPIKVKV